MPLIELTQEQHDALVSGYNRSVAIDFAGESKFLLSKLQRDVIAAAKQCKAILDAGWHPEVAVYEAYKATYLRTDLDRFSAEKMPMVKAIASQVYGFTADEINVSVLVIAAAVNRLLDTARDGSTIAEDVADILWQFVDPPSIYS